MRITSLGRVVVDKDGEEVQVMRINEDGEAIEIVLDDDDESLVMVSENIGYQSISMDEIQPNNNEGDTNG